MSNFKHPLLVDWTTLDEFMATLERAAQEKLDGLRYEQFHARLPWLVEHASSADDDVS